jgi:uncharacterized protein YbjT (DUF2867 family)
MPVVVIDADNPVGRDLVPLLRDRGSEVRATVRDAQHADPLRAAGAKVAADPVSDADILRAVLDEAHTVCVISADLLSSPGGSSEETIVVPTRSILRVAEKSGVTRILFVSYPGASATSTNDFLRSLGLAEDAVRGSRLQHAILRCTHIYGRGSPWLAMMVEASRQRPALVPGPGTQRLAPVFSEDVARALSAADDRAQPVSGTYGLQGPDVLTAEELVDLLNGRGGPKRSGAPLSRPWSDTIEEILGADSLADAPDANTEFGLKPTSLRDGLAASGVGAGEGLSSKWGGAHPG